MRSCYFGHKWSKWWRNYRYGGWRRSCEQCGHEERRYDPPVERDQEIHDALNELIEKSMEER